MTRYVTPLREGGSLPAIVEADDDGLYVLKFRGAGQGLKALVAELVAGEIARALGLRVPEIVFASLDAVLSLTEPDPEIQDLLRASAGLNLALDYLPGSITYDPLVETIDAKLASQIVWFDCFVTNVDRTPRNPNLLVWHERLWLIDHGAAFYVHHASDSFAARADAPFPAIRDHVLLPWAGPVAEADARLAPLLGAALVESVVAGVPEEWLDGGDEQRRGYVEYLLRRLDAPRGFVEEADAARLGR